MATALTDVEQPTFTLAEDEGVVWLTIDPRWPEDDEDDEYDEYDEYPKLDLGWDREQGNLIFGLALAADNGQSFQTGPVTPSLSLGNLLNALGITAEDCARAIAEDAAGDK